MTDLSLDAARTQRLAGLSAGQLATVAGVGASLWLCAALLLQWLGPLGIYDGLNRALLYALIVPGTVPFVLGLTALAKLGPGQTALGAAIGTATALCLDGIAVAWFPGLYGAETALTLGASAAILWGAGVFIFLGCLLDRSMKA